MARTQSLKAIPLNCRALAEYMGCSYESAVRITGKLASAPAWFFQHYHAVIFLRYRPHPSAPCGVPCFYLISRYSLHRIGGDPGRVRARLRQKTAEQWLAHLVRIKNLALAMIFRGRKAANDKHQGSPTGKQAEAARARPPPPKNRRACRRMEKEAGMLAARYSNIRSAPVIRLHGWLLNRLREWHSATAIEACLRHAVEVIPIGGPHRPKNPAAWICGVAERHLETDGLIPRIRRHLAYEAERQRKAGRSAPGF